MRTRSLRRSQSPRAGRAAPRFVGTVGARLSELTKALSKLGAPQSLCVVYEAGPCGYALARELARLSYRCEVVAPSRIPRRPGERIKTDRRDALKLAGLARAGELVPVTIPDERDEAIRDLSRARVDAVRARLKARGLHHNKICVALARELAGFLWDIGRHVGPST